MEDRERVRHRHHRHRLLSGWGLSRRTLRFGVVLVVGLVVLTAAGWAAWRYRKHVRNPATYIARGDALRKQGQTAEAIRQYERAVGFDSESVEALTKLAAALRTVKPDSPTASQDNTLRILRVLNQITRLEPKNTPAQTELMELLYTLAKTHSQTGLYEELERRAAEFARVNSANQSARKYKALAGVALMFRRAPDDARSQEIRADLEAALQAFPEDSDLVQHDSLWYMARSQQTLTNTVAEVSGALQASAEQNLRLHLGRHPDDLPSRFLLARVLVQQQNQTDAATHVATIEQALLDGRNADLLLPFARFLAGFDADATAGPGVRRAEALLRRHLAAHPEDLETQFTLAGVLRTTGQRDEARQLYDRVFRAEPAPDTAVNAAVLKAIRGMAGAELAALDVADTFQAPDTSVRTQALARARVTVDELKERFGSNALTDLLEGKILLQQGRPVEALARFESANQQFQGTNPEAIYYSALVLKETGETGAAAERLEKLTTQLRGDNLAKVYTHLVDVYLQLNQLTLAANAATRLGALVPADPDAAVLKGRVLLAQTANPADRTADLLREARALLEPLHAAGDSRATRLLVLFWLAYDQPATARDLLAVYAEQRPDDWVVLTQLVRLDALTGQQAAARQRIAAAAQRSPASKIPPLLEQQLENKGDPLALFTEILRDSREPFATAITLYEIYRQIGDAGAAAAALQQATELRPDDPAILETNFQKALTDRDWKTAQIIVSRAAKLNLDAARGLFWTARLQLSQGDYPRALAALQEGIKERPLYSEGWRLLGDGYQLSHDYDAAEKAYTEALRLRPNNLPVLYNLHLTHAALGRQDSALAALKRATDMAPHNAGLQELYVNYLGSVQPEQAVALRQATAQTNPEDWNNKVALARLLIERRQFAAADTLVRQLLTNAPEDGEYLALAAKLAIARGTDVEPALQRVADNLRHRGAAAGIKDWLRYARLLVAARRSAEAMAAYQEAIRREPSGQTMARRELADWLFQQQQFAEALPLYAAVLKTDRSEAVELRHIETLLQAGQLDEANRALSAFNNAHPNNMSGFLLEYRVALKAADPARAKAAVNRAIQLGPKHCPLGYLFRATLALQEDAANNRVAAMDDLRRALAQQPDLVAARIALANCYLLPGNEDLTLAAEELGRVLATQPDNTWARLTLCQVYQRQDKPDKLQTLLRESIAQSPEEPLWYKIRGEVFLQAEKYPEAIRDLRRALDLGRDALSYALLGRALLAAKQVTEAQRLFDDAPAVLQNHPLALIVHVAVLATAQQPERAQTTLDRAMKLVAGDPRRVRALVLELKPLVEPKVFAELLVPWAEQDQSGQLNLLLGETLWRDRDQVQVVIEQLEAARAKVERGGPAWLRCLHALALAQQTAGNYLQAEKLYKSLLEKNGDDLMALNNLAWLYADHLGKPLLALEQANRAVEVAKARGGNQPELAGVLDTLGWAQFKTGQLAEAKLNLERSIREDPTSLYNRYHLAEVLASSGLYAEARQQLQKARQIGEKEGDPVTLRQVHDLDAAIRGK